MLLLSACAAPGLPGVSPTPTPTPAEISAQISAATRSARSLSFTITVAGQPVFSDATRLFTIGSIEGSLQRPDGVRTILKLRGAVGVVEVRTVSLAGKQYATNPLTRAWQCLEPGTIFDPAALFDPQRGIEQLLQNGIEQVTLVGEETLNDRPVYHLRGVIPGERLAAISLGTIGYGPVQTDLWAGRDDLRLMQIQLVDQAPGAEQPTTWTMAFAQYDQPVDVRAPVECL
jgi:lipoprotein LprG